MSKTLSLSIIIPDHDSIPVTISKIDYFLSKRHYRSFEFILLEKDSNRKDDLAVLAEGFGEILPNILVSRPEELKKNIHGETVIFIEPQFDLSFDNFEELVDLSKKNDLVVYLYELNHWIYRFLDYVFYFCMDILNLDFKISGGPKAFFINQEKFRTGVNPDDIFRVNKSDISFMIKTKRVSNIYFQGFLNYGNIFVSLVRIFYERLKIKIIKGFKFIRDYLKSLFNKFYKQKR
ncbi:MAG: hypothetical protein ABEI53_01250 [Candidatus Magasanikbacteria bacterium]